MAKLFTHATFSNGSAQGSYILGLALKTLLVSAGWTVKRSGGGFGGAYSSSGDILTTLAAFNGGAWFVVQIPGSSGRQILIQMQNQAYWYGEYSFAGLYTGGSASAVPTAADGQAWFGISSSDGRNVITGGGADCRLEIMADDEAPYGWWLFTTPIGGSGLTGGPPYFPLSLLAFDPLAPNTEIPGDIDPYVLFGSYGDNNVQTSASSANCQLENAYNSGFGARCWLFKGQPSELWRTIAWAIPRTVTGAIVIPGAIGPNPYTAKDMLINVQYACAQVNVYPTPGWKGTSSLFWYSSTRRDIGDTFTVNNPRDYRSICGMAVDWDGSVPNV